MTLKRRGTFTVCHWTKCWRVCQLVGGGCHVPRPPIHGHLFWTVTKRLQGSVGLDIVTIWRGVVIFVLCENIDSPTCDWFWRFHFQNEPSWVVGLELDDKSHMVGCRFACYYFHHFKPWSKRRRENWGNFDCCSQRHLLSVLVIFGFLRQNASVNRLIPKRLWIECLKSYLTV